MHQGRLLYRGMWVSESSLAWQRWDYVLARWAYSTSIFSWELANENDDWAGWGPAAASVQVWQRLGYVHC